MYDVSDSYDKTQTKMEILPSTANSAFLSSNTRFAPPRDIALNETDSLNPGTLMIHPNVMYPNKWYK
jgi:hypothetical protein